MDTGTKPAIDLSLYERDFHAWCLEQGAQLRRRARPGVNDGLDYENLAEEIESLGRSERREIKSRLIVLLVHLLKWRHQIELRSRSWQSTISLQRREIAAVLSDSPSLKGFFRDAMADCYGKAVGDALTETGQDRSAFPPACPFSLDQLLDPGFLPEDVDNASGS